jgi:4-diphosphocytidyl-2-C-methyl-D-erythritol kinase
MNPAWTSWPAPAKLNLFLHIVGRRADGYHLLQTVFQLLDWGDTVHLCARADGVVARAGELPGVALESDLCLRAAHLLRERSRVQLGADIRVEKRIPIGGGLGGGSSDAATTLVGLNELWNTRLTVAELADLGLTLGADVPVFVHGRSAWAEGIGEVLTPIALPPRIFVVLDPGVSVPTRLLFAAAELTRNTPPATIGGYLARVDLGSAETMNAFAALVRERYPAVAAAMDWLSRFGEVSLSGSGGCVFVAVDSVDAGDAIVRACPPQFKAYRASGVVSSALLHALETYRAGNKDRIFS